MTKPAKRIKEGTIVSFGDGKLKAKCIQVLDEGIRKFELNYKGILYEILDELGEMPLPSLIFMRNLRIRIDIKRFMRRM